eukprot:s737_g44.t2
MKVFPFLATAGLFWTHLSSAAEDTEDTTDLLDALRDECDECDGRLSLLQLQVVQQTNSSHATEQVPMIAYPKKYCQHCGEMAFCHRASNPGCGGRATGGVASFNNHVRATGCKSNPTLTVPRSYMRDISALAHFGGPVCRDEQYHGCGSDRFLLVEVPAVSASPHQLHLRGTPGGRPSPPGSPHRTNVGFSRDDTEHSALPSPQSPPITPAPTPPPPKEPEMPSPPPERPVSPGNGPTGVGNSMLATKSQTIPRFWWPKRDQISELGQEYKDQIHNIFLKQGITDGIKTWEQCEPIVTEVFKLSKYFAAPIFHKMKVFYDIIDRSSISKRDAMMVATPVPITEMMVIGWANRKIQPEDPTLSFYSVVKKDHNDWIEKEDFDIFLHAILMTHPGLEFLLETQEFQDRYSDTVTSRIFYIYDRKGTGRIHLQNLRRYQPSIIETWKQLEEFDDMKMIRDYFSYEHFYVIYCTFWELDSDHDFLLDKDDLLKYDGHALSRRTVDRIFSEVTWKFTSAVPGKMGYEDFIHFLLNDQDQITDRSIEFWFNIFDLDADGVVRDHELQAAYLTLLPPHLHVIFACDMQPFCPQPSASGASRLVHRILSATMADRKAVIKNADMAEDMQQDAIDCATQALEKYNIEKDIAAFIKKDGICHTRDQALHLFLSGSGGDSGLQVRMRRHGSNNLKYFYEEQVQRMECLNYETIAFHDVLCQLHDMIGPRVNGEFRLADFKRKRKFAGSFFSIFTSLNKFMAFENRDPFQAKQEQMENPGSTAWHKWCADQYLRYVVGDGRR